MWFGVSTMGRLRRVSAPAETTTWACAAADSAGDDVQLAGGGVVLRERCEGATLSGQIDGRNVSSAGAQFEGGEVDRRTRASCR